MKLRLPLLFALISSISSPAWAQESFQDGYDDYGAFQTDPVDLDTEYQEIFGRFFQINFHLGTSILTGGLGNAHSAGLMFGGRFIFFFDKMLAAELSASYSSQSGLYDETNTDVVGVEIDQTMKLIPLTLGIRYVFDQDTLPRGFAAMNPYIVGVGEIVFRSEDVKTAKTTGLQTDIKSEYVDGATINSLGWGATLGGGFEFDVYRKRLFLGLDLRYHIMFWSDASKFIGEADRKGNYISVLGSVSYNY